MKKVLATFFAAIIIFGGLGMLADKTEGQIGGGGNNPIYQMPVAATAPFTCNTTNRGYIYYNTTSNKHFGCNGTSWKEVALKTIAGAYDIPISSAAPTTCNNTTRGYLYYDTDDNKMRYCNGTDWVIAGLPAGTNTPDAIPCDTLQGKEFVDLDGNLQIGTLITATFLMSDTYTLGPTTISIIGGRECSGGQVVYTNPISYFQTTDGRARTLENAPFNIDTNCLDESLRGSLWNYALYANAAIIASSDSDHRAISVTAQAMGIIPVCAN